MTPTFREMYPMCSQLNLRVVDAGPGFDELELLASLGQARMDALKAFAKSVFSCNHAKYPEGHDLAGYEVHCFYASDVEEFLKAGG